MRTGTKREKIVLNEADWFLIEGFIQDLYLVKKKLSSDTFIILLDKRLKEECDSEETIQAIKDIVV